MCQVFHLMLLNPTVKTYWSLTFKYRDSIDGFRLPAIASWHLQNRNGISHSHCFSTVEQAPGPGKLQFLSSSPKAGHKTIFPELFFSTRMWRCFRSSRIWVENQTTQFTNVLWWSLWIIPSSSSNHISPSGKTWKQKGFMHFFVY